MQSGMIGAMRKQLELSLGMIEGEIEACPDTLWNEKAGGFVFWQQILHALTGTLYWTRTSPGGFTEPFCDREVYPELDGDPVGRVTKEEMLGLAGETRKAVEAFLAGKDDAWLLAPNAIYAKISNADVAIGQIRHLMYHAGHCDSALRERGNSATEWLEYYG